MKNTDHSSLIKHLFICLLFSLPIIAHAQTPDWQLAISPTHGNSSSSKIAESSADVSGNIYLTGTFKGSINFDGTTLTSRGGSDMFIAKWSTTARRFTWAEQGGGTGDDVPFGVVVNETGVYVAGDFASATATFGSTALVNVGPPSSIDIFVVKLTETGAFSWAQRAGGTNNDNCTAVAVNGTSVYLCGNFFSSTISFGNLVLSNGGNTGTTADDYLVKLTDAGNSASFAWAQRFGGTGLEVCYGLEVRGSSVYLAGGFESTANFGSTTLSSSSRADVFVTKVSDAGTSGSFVWAQRAGGPGADAATFLTVSGSNIYVGGYFSGASAIFGNTTLTSTGAGDLFVTRLTDAGSSASFAWAQQAGNQNGIVEGEDNVWGMEVSGASLYVSGSFGRTTRGFGTTTLTSAGSTDIFVAKLTDTGSGSTSNWTQRAGGTGSDECFALAVSNATVYVAGYVTPPASFGNLAITSPVGMPASFLASIADANALPILAPNANNSNVTVYPNPAHTTATVRLPATTGAVVSCVTLTDALGRIVRTYPWYLFTPPQAELNLTGLAPGVYALRIALQTKAITTRLAIE